MRAHLPLRTKRPASRLGGSGAPLSAPKPFAELRRGSAGPSRDESRLTFVDVCDLLTVIIIALALAFLLGALAALIEVSLRYLFA